MDLRFILSLLLLGVTLASGYESFQDYTVIRATPRTKEHVSHLIELQATENFDFWKDPGLVNTNVDIMVNKNSVGQLLRNIRQQGMKTFILHSDIDSLVQATLKKPELKSLDNNKHNMTWDHYHRLDDVHGYVRYLAEKYPELCTLQDLGASFEGRPMLMLVIENKESEKAKKKVMIDGGIHAREWISVAVVSHLLKDFIEDYEKHSYVLDHFIIHIIPSINPDGYEYSHTHKRLWRKTRSINAGDECRGADPNRNFDYHWAESGVSFNPCSDVYPGSKALSEVEMQYIAQHLTGDIKFDMYLSFHSFSQMILYPWGYDQIPCSDEDDLMRVGQAGASAIERATGEKYRPGVSSILLGAAAGGSDDYAKAVGGVKYSYTVELRDTGRFGFLLPPKFIAPTVKEARAMTLAMMLDILEN